MKSKTITVKKQDLYKEDMEAGSTLTFFQIALLFG